MNKSMPIHDNSRFMNKSEPETPPNTCVLLIFLNIRTGGEANIDLQHYNMLSL